MNKNKTHYSLVFLSMLLWSGSAIYYESYYWLVGTFWYLYYLYRWRYVLKT